MLKWVVGNFQTGAITESSDLPVIKGSDKITQNINGEDFATLRVSKRDLPDPAVWTTYLKPGYTMVAAVDTSKAWNAEGAVLFAGFVKEAKLSVGESISIQVAGFREYASNRIVSTIKTGTATDPEAMMTFQGNTWQMVLNAVANDLWVSTGFPASSPKPPTATKGTVSPNPTGTTFKAEIRNVETMKYSDVFDYIRDDLSGVGEEYTFKARWSSAGKTNIVFDFITGTAAAPQINKNQTFNVDLSATDNFALGLGKSLTLTDYATRLFAMSTQTEDATDYKIYDTGVGSDLLVDNVFNPGVELTPTELNTFTTERLNSQKLLQEEGEILVVSNNTDTWRTRVGASVSVVGGASNPDTAGMTLAMRLVEVSYSLSDTKVETRIMMNKARYGRLPNSPTNGNKFGNPSLGSSGPITPKLPDNMPLPGGGGGAIPLPDFDNSPIFKSSHQVFSDPTSANGYGTALGTSFGAKNSDKIYKITAPGSGNFIETGTLTSPAASHSWGSCDDYFNDDHSQTFSNILTVREIDLNGTTNPPQRILYDFDLSVLESWDFAGSLAGSGLYMDHSIIPRLHATQLWWHAAIDGDDLFLIIYGLKIVWANSANLTGDAWHSQGHKIYRNKISTGTDLTWEDTGWDNAFEFEGRPLTPTSSQNMVAKNGKLLMAGGLNYTGWQGANIPEGVHSDFISFTVNDEPQETSGWENPLYRSGIFELDLQSGEFSEKFGDIAFDDFSGSLELEGEAPISNSHYPSGSWKWVANPNAFYEFRKTRNGDGFLFQRPGVGWGLTDNLSGTQDNAIRVGYYTPEGGKQIAVKNLGQNPANIGSPASSRQWEAFVIEDWIGVTSTVSTSQPYQVFWTKNMGESWIETLEIMRPSSYITVQRRDGLPDQIKARAPGASSPTKTFLSSWGVEVFARNGRAYTSSYETRVRSWAYNLNFS